MGTYTPFSASKLSPFGRWCVDGCTSNTAFVADPVLTDVSAATGKVVCCRGEYAATRDASSGVCLGGQVSKTFWEAKTICEGEGWRVCRKEELLMSDSAGSCGQGCYYDNERIWADFDPGEAPWRAPTARPTPT